MPFSSSGVFRAQPEIAGDCRSGCRDTPDLHVRLHDPAAGTDDLRVTTLPSLRSAGSPDNRGSRPCWAEEKNTLSRGSVRFTHHTVLRGSAPTGDEGRDDVADVTIQIVMSPGRSVWSSSDQRAIWSDTARSPATFAARSIAHPRSGPEPAGTRTASRMAAPREAAVLRVAKVRSGGHAYYLEVAGGPAGPGSEAPGRWLGVGRRRCRCRGGAAGSIRRRPRRGASGHR